MIIMHVIINIANVSADRCEAFMLVLGDFGCAFSTIIVQLAH